MRSLLSRIDGLQEFDLSRLRVERPAWIYFLIVEPDVVYVGQTTNIEQRIALHLNAGKRFDRVLHFGVTEADADAYEGALIRRINPRWSRRAPADRGRDAEVLALLGLEPDKEIADTFARRSKEDWRMSRLLTKRRQAMSDARWAAECDEEEGVL